VGGGAKDNVTTSKQWGKEGDLASGEYPRCASQKTLRVTKGGTRKGPRQTYREAKVEKKKKGDKKWGQKEKGEEG